ncbi:MAG: hypothetical protein LBL34_01625 [Clostridiales bacterium]|jgi:hypothetical protein|nr:hypothetical protein [Clostridiales bacterium]
MKRQIENAVLRILEKHNFSQLYLHGLSADFVFEQKICQRFHASLIGADTSFPQKVLGHYFAGQLDDIEQVISAIYKESSKSHKRVPTANHQDSQCEKIKNKLSQVDLQLESFQETDIFDFIQTLPQKASFVCAKPLRPTIANKLIPILKELDCSFVIVLGTLYDDIKGMFSAQIVGNKGRSMFIYSNISTTKRYYRPQQTLKEKTIPKIKTLDFSSNISLAKISKGQFAQLQSLYLSRRIRVPVTPDLCFGVFAGDKLLGAFGFSTDYIKRIPYEIERPSIYLMSDLSISAESKMRLSKLVLYCALSKETQLLIEQSLGKRMHTVYTNVFSENPSSMKYRGLFTLHKRVKTINGYNLG